MIDDILARIFSREWVILVTITPLLLVITELGFRLGLRLHKAEDAARKAQISGIQAGVLGFLGLLLGFTFAMAVDRYEARRTLVVKEANAIGTTHLRASLLPEAHHAPVKDLIRRYVYLRLTYQPLAYDRVKLRGGYADECGH